MENEKNLEDALAMCERPGSWAPAEIVAKELRRLSTARPIAEWHEDDGPVLWWKLPVSEPPFCGTPNDSDWPGYHTHWTPLPRAPESA